MTTTLSHDAFARTELVRRRWRDYYEKGCDDCGSTRLSVLYEYGTRQDDSGRVNWHKGHFCGKSCHDDYHS